MLSLAELRRAVRVLDAKLAGARLDRIVQTDAFTLVLVLGPFGPLLVSARPELARMSAPPEPPPAPAKPLQFAQFLNARIHRAHARGARLVGEDRQAAVAFEGREGRYELLFQVLGPRTNAYLLDSAGVVLASLRPLEETRRDLAIGAPWQNPPSRPPREGDDRWAAQPDELYLAAIETTYRELERKKAAEELDRRIAQALARETEFLDKKASNLAEDLGKAAEARSHLRRGELLKGVLHEIAPRQTEVRVTDYETGEELAIPLDPSLTPAANLESCFNRYHKEVRRIEAVEEQLAEVRRSQGRIDAIAAEFREASRGPERDLEALGAFSGRPEVRRLLARHAPARRERGYAGPAPRKKREHLDVPARLRPKRFRSSEGLEIWVGRSDEGNDYLTTRLARGNDLFVHLEGSPGSHVVLRTEGRADPPPASLLDACELAVHFSKQKGATRADVHVTPIKNVRKPRGAKAGLVYVQRGKTVHLRRDPKRLERILAARLEE